MLKQQKEEDEEQEVSISKAATELYRWRPSYARATPEKLAKLNPVAFCALCFMGPSLREPLRVSILPPPIKSAPSPQELPHCRVPGRVRGLLWLLRTRRIFPLLLAARALSAVLNVVHDCDEVFNYWEPLHYLLYGYGLQTWEYRHAARSPRPTLWFSASPSQSSPILLRVSSQADSHPPCPVPIAAMLPPPCHHPARYSNPLPALPSVLRHRHPLLLPFPCPEPSNCSHPNTSLPPTALQ